MLYLKTNFKRLNFKNLTGFYSRTHELSSIHPIADRKALRGAVRNEGLLLAEGSGNKEVRVGSKADWLLQGHFRLGRVTEVLSV